MHLLTDGRVNTGKGEHLPDSKLIDWFQTEHKEINFRIIFTMVTEGWGGGWGGVKRSQEDFLCDKTQLRYENLFRTHFNMDISDDDET